MHCPQSEAILNSSNLVGNKRYKFTVAVVIHDGTGGIRCKFIVKMSGRRSWYEFVIMQRSGRRRRSFLFGHRRGGSTVGLLGFGFLCFNNPGWRQTVPEVPCDILDGSLKNFFVANFHGHGGGMIVAMNYEMI